MSNLGEIFSKPVHRPQLVDPLLPIPDAKVGIEIEVERWDGAAMPGLWDAKKDESLRNKGIEFVTRGGLIGAEIREQVFSFCKHAVDRKFSDGEPRAGIHIHIDATDLDVERGDLPRLVANYLLVEHIFFGFAGDWRRSCGYCEAMESSQDDFAELGGLLYSGVEGFIKRAAKRVKYLSKYQALNLKPLGDLGTLEFRHLPTTFDPVRIMNWIYLILALKKSSSSIGLDDPLHMLSSVGPENYIRQILGNGLAHVWQPYFNAGRVWVAVDNATALMARGFDLDKPSVAKSWSDVSCEPSPILKAKLERLNEVKRAKKQPKANEVHY